MRRTTIRMVGCVNCILKLICSLHCSLLSLFSSLIRFHLITNLRYRLGNGNSYERNRAKWHQQIEEQKSRKKWWHLQKQNKKNKSTLFRRAKNFHKSCMFWNYAFHCYDLFVDAIACLYALAMFFFLKMLKVEFIKLVQVSPHFFHPVHYSIQATLVCKRHGYPCLLQSCTLRETEEASVWARAFNAIYLYRSISCVNAIVYRSLYFHFIFPAIFSKYFKIRFKKDGRLSPIDLKHYLFVSILLYSFPFENSNINAWTKAKGGRVM